MTDELKIVRIRARNVPRTRTQALIGDDAFLASLSRSRKATVSHARWAGEPSCWNTTKSSPDNLAVMASMLIFIFWAKY